MTGIEFFKSQAKKLYKDYKTKTSYVDDVDGKIYYQYSPKNFDISGLFLAYDLNENEFSLMKAQHMVAQMVGFRRWADLLRASPVELELARLIFENKVDFEEWQMYLAGVEGYNREALDSDSKLEKFKAVFLEGRAYELYQDPYRLD